jgi:cytochrome c biogenesis protein CcmG, thiol:disulfide interchange protein DsbE
MPTPRTVLAALLLLPLLAACGSERVTIGNDEPAPAFELARLEGGTVTLNEFQGQVVALRFWADWCPFCRHEMRELEPLYQQLHQHGLEILAVNVGQDRSRVERFLDRVQYSYPTLLDPESTIARRYGVIAIPVTYFIDRDGIVRGRILGESDNATFERMAAALLNLGASTLRPDPASVGGMGGPPAGRRQYLPLVLTAASMRPTPADGQPIPPPTGEEEQP